MKKRLIIGVLILVVGIGVSVALRVFKPKAERRRRPRMTPVVTCTSLQRTDHRVELDVLGTVIPARQSTVKAQVSGQIVSTCDEWIEGGLVSQGTPMIQIDPADYRIALAQAEAALAQAKSDASLEQGRQDVARSEWDLLGSHHSSADEQDLALRGPQLRAIEARVASARARVEKARLDLERTSVNAPFNALIVKRHADVGDLAGIQSPLATIADTDSFHVRVSLPVAELRWISEDAKAVISFAGGKEVSGKVIGKQLDLDERSRMARLLVEIDEPLSHDADVLLNSFVNVRLEGKTVTDAYVIDRNYLRPNSQIFLLTSDSKLRVLSVEPAWTGKERVVLREEIGPGERLITSALSVVIDGMDLRLKGDKPDGGVAGSGTRGNRPGRGNKEQ